MKTIVAEKESCPRQSSSFLKAFSAPLPPWQAKAATRFPASCSRWSRAKVRSGGAILAAQTGKPRMT